MTRAQYDKMIEGDFHDNSIENDSWLPLTGCFLCINQKVCEVNKSCIMLKINEQIPLYTKAKRRLIGRIKTLGSGDPTQLEKYFIKVNKIKNKQPKIITPKKQKVQLTVFEKMCIESLKKPR